MLFTTSLFESKYTGSDGIERNTAFNGNYVFNALAGYEFSLNKNLMATIDLKGILAGGQRYIPIDIEESQRAHSTKYDYDKAYMQKHDPYFRTDLRLGLKHNAAKFSQEWAVDFQNISNYQSIYAEGYNADKGEIYHVYQQGFYPMFLYRIQF